MSTLLSQLPSDLRDLVLSFMGLPIKVHLPDDRNILVIVSYDCPLHQLETECQSRRPQARLPWGFEVEIYDQQMQKRLYVVKTETDLHRLLWKTRPWGEPVLLAAFPLCNDSQSSSFGNSDSLPSSFSLISVEPSSSKGHAGTRTMTTAEHDTSSGIIVAEASVPPFEFSPISAEPSSKSHTGTRTMTTSEYDMASVKSS